MQNKTTCQYCGTSYGSQEQLTNHLIDQHDPSALSSIDQRRLEQYQAAQPPRLTRRTALVGTLAGLGAAVGGLSIASDGVHPATVAANEKTPPIEQSIDLSNAVHDITVGEQTSSGWTYNGRSQLYREYYALRTGGTTYTSDDTDNSILEAYPDTGDPGTVYAAVVEFGDLSAEVTRLVKLDPTEALITITYEIRNAGSTDLSDVNFYQFTDYDVDSGSSDDAGEYVSTPFEYIYQQDVGSGEDTVIGYRGAVDSDAHDVDQLGTVIDNVSNGSLGNSDSAGDPDGSGTDVGSAFRFDLGTLAPNEQATRTIAFAAGDSQNEVETLLETIESIGSGTVTISDTTISDTGVGIKIGDN